MRAFMKMISGRKQFSLVSDGDSMLPLLQSDDLIYYRVVPYTSIEENDLVLVWKNGGFFTHRVIYKTPRYLITKGDNNPASDGKIKPQEIVAKAIRLKRNGRIVKLNELYTMQSFLYLHEIEQVLALIQKKGVQVVLLKGLPLHMYYEGGRPKRIYGDCDILIQDKDARKVQTALQQLGYRKLNLDLSKHHGKMRDKRTEESYFKILNTYPVIFDVHYEAVFMMTQLGKLDRLYPQSMIDRMTADFLREKKIITVGGIPIPLLSDYHLPVYLALHFFHHNFKGVYRLTMLDAVLKKVSKNNNTYDDMARFIKTFHLNGFTYPVFLLLMKYYRSNIPPFFLRAIKPQSSQYTFMKKEVLPISPFDESNRLQGGITRFRQLFYLSPEPFMQKSLVFLTPSVLYTLVWVLVKRLISLPLFTGTSQSRP